MRPIVTSIIDMLGVIIKLRVWKQTVFDCVHYVRKIERKVAYKTSLISEERDSLNGICYT